MPKKFGTSSKSSEARERKAEVKKQKQAAEQKIKEDKLWEDNDKSLQAKESRKKELEEKKLKEKERKEENKRLADQETEQFGKKTTQAPPQKKTRHEIEEAKQAALKAMQDQIKKKEKDEEKEILENLDKDINPNHAFRDEQAKLAESGASLHVGSGLDDALEIAEEEKMFKHPEKKVRQAWNLYIENHMDRARRENPGLKRSQLLGLLRKDFDNSEENPFNQKFVSYNTKLG